MKKWSTMSERLTNGCDPSSVDQSSDGIEGQHDCSPTLITDSTANHMTNDDITGHLSHMEWTPLKSQMTSVETSLLSSSIVCSTESVTDSDRDCNKSTFRGEQVERVDSLTDIMNRRKRKRFKAHNSLLSEVLDQRIANKLLISNRQLQRPFSQKVRELIRRMVNEKPNLESLKQRIVSFLKLLYLYIKQLLNIEEFKKKENNG